MALVTAQSTVEERVPVRRAVGVVPLVSLAALAVGVFLLLALHVLPPTDEISPMRRTLSQYALSPNKWIFDLAVLLVAAGSALGFLEVARRRLVRPLSATVLLGLLWTVSLLVIVAFTKNNWAYGPSMGGMVHRYASLVAFISLPFAVISAAGAVFPGAAGWRRLARGLAIMSLLWFGLIVLGVINMLTGGGPWWQFAPLGLVERMIALSAVTAAAVLIAGLTRYSEAGSPNSAN
jgi:hypothetical protein